MKVNPTDWVPDDLNQLPLDYSHMIRSAIKHRDLSGHIPFYGWHEYPITAVFTCRGCSYHCGTCGGSQETYHEFCHRQKPAFRDAELVASDVSQIARYFNGPLFFLGDIFLPGEQSAYGTRPSMEGCFVQWGQVGLAVSYHDPEEGQCGRRQGQQRRRP